VVKNGYWAVFLKGKNFWWHKCWKHFRQNIENWGWTSTD